MYIFKKKLSQSHLWQIPVVKRHHRLQSPVDHRVEDIMIVLYTFCVGFIALSFGIDAAPRERNPKGVEAGRLHELGILIIPETMCIRSMYAKREKETRQKNNKME